MAEKDKIALIKSLNIRGLYLPKNESLKTINNMNIIKKKVEGSNYKPLQNLKTYIPTGIKGGI